MRKKEMLVRTAGILLALGIASGVTACSSDNAAQESSAVETTETGKTAASDSESAEAENRSGTQIANPWSEYDTLEEARKAAGFDITVPAVPKQYESVICRVMDGLLEVYWEDSGGNRLTIRKGQRAGMDPDTTDISGDYSEYSEVKTVDVSGKAVEERGSDGLVHTAVWSADDFAYAVFSDTGLSEEEMERLAAGTE